MEKTQRMPIIMKKIIYILFITIIFTSSASIAQDMKNYKTVVCEYKDISTSNGLKRVKITIAPKDTHKNYSELQNATTAYRAMDYFNTTEEFKDFVLINVLLFENCSYKKLLARAQIGEGTRICTVLTKTGFKDMMEEVTGPNIFLKNEY